MTELNDFSKNKPSIAINTKMALSSASALLAAQWVMAAVSIPSANDYASQLSEGTPANQIVTLYDNLALLITIAMVWSWIATSRLLLPVYDATILDKPDSMRLKRGWVTWAWITPIVSFWFPRRIVSDVLKAKLGDSDQAKLAQRAIGTWWATWVSFVLINNLSAINAITGNSSAITPSYEIAAACMLTASFTVWTKLVRAIGS